MKARITPYLHLMRLHRPIGIFLLGWPPLIALWLAAEAHPAWSLVLIFSAGIVVMRSLGCVINDLTDRPFDGEVARTQDRPLVAGTVTPKGAYALCGLLGLIALGLVLLTTWQTVCLSVVGLALTALYPWMKRVMPVPQLVLGAAFAWAIPMAYMAVQRALPLDCWLLFAATLLWTVAYDTLYAMADREDDLKIGVKSSAIFLGRYDRPAVFVMQMGMLLLLCLLGYQQQLQGPFYGAILGGVLFTLWQDQRIKDRAPEVCFQAFLNHQWLGALLFLGVVFG